MIQTNGIANNILLEEIHNIQSSTPDENDQLKKLYQLFNKYPSLQSFTINNKEDMQLLTIFHCWIATHIPSRHYIEQFYDHNNHIEINWQLIVQFNIVRKITTINNIAINGHTTYYKYYTTLPSIISTNEIDRYHCGMILSDLGWLIKNDIHETIKNINNWINDKIYRACATKYDRPLLTIENIPENTIFMTDIYPNTLIFKKDNHYYTYNLEKINENDFNKYLSLLKNAP